MNKNIKTSNEYIGLPEEVYTLNPAKSSNFEYSYQIEEFKQPQNFTEQVIEILNQVKRKFRRE